MPPPQRIRSKLDDFYASHNIDITNLTSFLPFRFIRLSPRFDKRETLELLKKELAAPSASCNANHSNDDNEKSLFPARVPWLSVLEFYALPGDFNLNQSNCFRTGRVYGQDVSSGAAVAALLTSHYDCIDHDNGIGGCASNSVSLQTEKERGCFRVLDLCCSPGLKLCAIADYYYRGYRSNADTPKDTTQRNAIIGVDISEERMNVTKKIVTKYQVECAELKIRTGDIVEMESNEELGQPQIRMYVGDGQFFGSSFSSSPMNLVWDANVARDEYESLGKRKRLNKSARARQRKRLREIFSDEELHTRSPTGCGLCIEPFHHVLVDAECTTDGSLKHIQEMMAKRSASSTPTLELPRLTDPKQLSELVQLQKNLAASGFRLLRDGGTMVYSTCSLCREQNEGVVGWLLKQHEAAELVPISFPLAESDLVKEGIMPGTVQFLPNTTSADLQTPESVHRQLFGGGFFLAKLRKRVPSNST